MKKFKSLIARFFLRVLGWKLEGKGPDLDQYIVLAAPHTTNWDFLYIILVSWAHGLKFHWCGKKELFIFPFGSFLEWMGGVPIERSQAKGQVDQLADRFEANPEYILLIPPEGTRKRVEKFKTGFYHISLRARVPLVLGYLDYKKKVAGLGPVFKPTGDYEADLKKIYDFYRNVSPKYAENFYCPE